MRRHRKNLRIRVGTHRSEVHPTMTKTVPVSILSRKTLAKSTHKKTSCVRAAANKINPARSLSKGLQEESERKSSTMYLSDQLSRAKSNSCRLRDPLSSRKYVVIAVAPFSNDLANS